MTDEQFNTDGMERAVEPETMSDRLRRSADSIDYAGEQFCSYNIRAMMLAAADEIDGLYQGIAELERRAEKSYLASEIADLHERAEKAEAALTAALPLVGVERADRDLIAWAICPSIREYSCGEDVQIECKFCPDTIETDYGVSQQACRHAANVAADRVLALPHTGQPQEGTAERNAALEKCREVLATVAGNRRQYGPIATHAQTALNQLAYADRLSAAPATPQRAEEESDCPCGRGAEPCPRPDGKPLCAAPQAGYAKEGEAERIVGSGLGSIEVDARGSCKWTDVANAMTHIKAQLRALPAPSLLAEQGTETKVMELGPHDRKWLLNRLMDRKHMHAAADSADDKIFQRIEKTGAIQHYDAMFGNNYYEFTTAGRRALADKRTEVGK